MPASPPSAEAAFPMDSVEASIQVTPCPAQSNLNGAAARTRRQRNCSLLKISEIFSDGFVVGTSLSFRRTKGMYAVRDWYGIDFEISVPPVSFAKKRQRSRNLPERSLRRERKCRNPFARCMQFAVVHIDMRQSRSSISLQLQ